MCWQERNITFENGIYFGYPLCCINEFIDDLSKGESPHRRNKLAGIKTDGAFHPCRKHTQDILDGKIKIEDLIDSRVCPYPFPYRHSHSIR